MTLSRPEVRLALAGGTALSAAEAALVRLQVDLSLGAAHDCAVLTLWPGSALAGAAPGDALTVALGDGDADPTTVLTADVTGVQTGPGATVLTALAPSARLDRTWVGRSWRQTTLAQVVRDLLDEGGADAGAVDADLALPALSVDPQRSAWAALHDLARRTGHQVTTAADGSVEVGPAPAAAGAGGLGALGAAVAAASSLLGLGGARLRRGADLLDVDHEAWTTGGPAGPDAPRTTPVSARAAFLLEAEPDDGSAVTVLDPALRTREAADAATGAAAGRAARRGTRARLTAPVRPDLRPGATVEADTGDGPQSYRVLAVRHVLDRTTGATTSLELEAAS